MLRTQTDIGLSSQHLEGQLLSLGSLVEAKKPHLLVNMLRFGNSLSEISELKSPHNGL
jgi:hypothetical protein